MSYFRFIITIICFFSSSSAYSVSGHNTPILLNLRTYHSLDPYQKAIDGDIKLHLTLVFTQMSNEMIAAVKDPLEEQLQNPYLLGKRIEDMRLDFKEFGLLGNHIVAFFVPKDHNSYQEFIETIRQSVREMAGNMGNLQYVQKDSVEYGRLGNTIVYTMDIRDPVPHVSLKYKGSAKEAQKLNNLLQNGVLQRPKSIDIRLNQIEIQLTKAIDLGTQE